MVTPTRWEPGFVREALAFARARWGKGPPRTIHLEEPWRYPAVEAGRRFVGITLEISRPTSISAYHTVVLEAQPAAGRWRFQPLPADPLPTAAQVAAYRFLAHATPPTLVDGAPPLIDALRALGVDARPRSELASRRAALERQGFQRLAVERTWWPDHATAYARLYFLRHPPGNDVSYESWGTLRLTRRHDRWSVTDLHDWQGE